MPNLSNIHLALQAEALLFHRHQGKALMSRTAVFTHSWVFPFPSGAGEALPASRAGTEHSPDRDGAAGHGGHLTEFPAVL